MSQTTMGRTDQSTSVMNWRTRANVTLALYGVAAAGSWHLAVAATSSVRLNEPAETLKAAASGHPLGALPGPTPNGAATGTVFGLFLAVLVALVLASAYLRGRRAQGRRQKGLAGHDVVRDVLGTDHARETAAQTRPGLTAEERRKVDITEVGLPLGDSGNVNIVLSLEDHLAVLAPTGGGKTTQLMIPAALCAPGALVITCTGPDILDVVAEARARRGRIWVFDPLDRLGWPEPMVWDPVAGAADSERAASRGKAFAAGFGADGSDSTNAGFFRKQAGDALTYLLHAAALDQRPMSDVIEWAMQLDDGAEVPQDIIRRSTDPRAEPMWPGLLRGIATGADDTVASARATLQGCVDQLARRSILRWVIPRSGVATFDAAAFVRSTDTLVLVADTTSSSNVAPLCAMLLQEVYDQGKALAARSPRGRVDPPIRLVGDEIANVAPLDKLSDQITNARQFMQMIVALQGLTQAIERWGENGATTLLGQCTEMYLPGLKDLRALERASDLAGTVEVMRAGTTVDSTGRVATLGEQWTEAKVVRPDEARMLPAGTGLLISRSAPPVVIAMTPWFRGPHAQELEAARLRTEARRIAAAAPAVVDLTQVTQDELATEEQA